PGRSLKKTRLWGAHAAGVPFAAARRESEMGHAVFGGLRLAQAEIAFRLVERHGDLQAAIVGYWQFGGGLPVRQGKARRRLEDESGGRQRPGNRDSRVAAHNGEVDARGDARVQQHRYRGNPSFQIHPTKVRYREVGFAVAVEVARRYRP